jgi:CP family cyanate transporter-like MFS transporter
MTACWARASASRRSTPRARATSARWSRCAGRGSSACRWPRRSPSPSWWTLSSTRRPKSSSAELTAAVVLTGLNLRPLFGSLPPLLADIRADLGLSAAAAGLLTTGPLLCLGILAPIGPRIARRYPVERLLAGAALATAAGTALRGAGGAASLYAGTLLAGAAIALAQVVVPALVRARAPARAGSLTGAYSMSLVAGATVATFTAIRLEHLLGGWAPALAVWGVPALAAVAIWIPLAVRAHDPVPAPVGSPPWRAPLGWSIALFMGLQSMCFFSTISWLPEILHSDGISKGHAGTLAGVTQLVQVAPAFAVPVLAARARHQLGVLSVIVATTLIGLAGVLAAPGAALAWMVILGIGQGGALGLGLILPVLRGRDAAEVASFTAMAMGVGYLISSAGPAIVGAARDASGGWTWPLIVLLTMAVVQFPAAYYAASKGRPT